MRLAEAATDSAPSRGSLKALWSALQGFTDTSTRYPRNLLQDDNCDSSHCYGRVLLYLNDKHCSNLHDHSLEFSTSHSLPTQWWTLIMV